MNNNIDKKRLELLSRINSSKNESSEQVLDKRINSCSSNLLKEFNVKNKNLLRELVLDQINIELDVFKNKQSLYKFINRLFREDILHTHTSCLFGDVKFSSRLDISSEYSIIYIRRFLKDGSVKEILVVLDGDLNE